MWHLLQIFHDDEFEEEDRFSEIMKNFVRIFMKFGYISFQLILIW